MPGPRCIPGLRCSPGLCCFTTIRFTLLSKRICRISFIATGSVSTRTGRVVFAITEFGETNLVNLYDFAELFRSLGCRDALFLDGDISGCVVNPTGPIVPGNHFGAIIAVTRPIAK